MNRQHFHLIRQCKKNCIKSPCALSFAKTRLALAISALVTGLGGMAAPTFAGPEGGVVTGGSGTISQNGSTTTINQSTDLMAIDWNSFDVGADETVQYIQPDASSVSLNRILSNNGSVIQGQIDANGQVILVNPHGIIFTATSVINAGGILASGLTIDTSEFMNGDFAFEAVEGTDGVVINSGLLNAATGGSVNLLGKQVINDGLIQADLGRVSLAAGNAAVVSFDTDGLIGITVTESVLQDELGVDPAILNTGDISAAGGKVLISAAASRDIFSAAVNTDDLRQATSVVMDDDGGFTLSAGANVVNTGTVDVSVQTASNNSTLNNTALDSTISTTGGSVVILGENIEQIGTVTANSVVGDGGSIEIHAVDTTLIQDGASLNASSLTADAGDIKVLGNNVGLLADTTVEATGATNGGEVLIGGDYRGENNLIPTATAVYFDREATITANATESGSAGKVILWGDDSLKAYGDISAAGFGLADGGFVETSAGVVNLDLLVDSSAETGDGGEWLIDPYNIIIQSDEDGNSEAIDDSISGSYFSSNQNSILYVETLRNALNNGATVTVETTIPDPDTSNLDEGDITLLSQLDFDRRENSTLILRAHNDINIEANISDENEALGDDSLSLIFISDSDTNGMGNINIAEDVEILTSGGSFLSFGNDFTLGSQDTDTMTSVASINTDGGSVSIYSTGDVSIYDSIITDGGDLTIGGTYSGTEFTNGDYFANSVTSYFAENTTDNLLESIGLLDTTSGTDGNIFVTSTGEILLGTLNTGNVNGDGDGEVNLTTTGEASSATVISSGGLTFGEVDITGDFIVTAGGNTRLNNTIVGGDLNVTAINGGDIYAVDPSMTEPNNDFSVYTNNTVKLDITGSTTFTAHGDWIYVSNTANEFTGEISVDTSGTSDSNLDGTGASTNDGGGLLVLAGSELTLGDISSSGVGTGGANTITITTGSLTANGAIEAIGGNSNSAAITIYDSNFIGGTETGTNEGSFIFNSESSWSGASFTVNGGGGNDEFTLNSNMVGADFLGGDGDDTFTIGAIAAAGDIDGGAGSNTLTTTLDINATINNWRVTAENEGSFQNNTADSGIVNFDEISNLIGSTGDDTFTIATAGSITGTISGTSSTTDTTGNDILVGKDNENIWNINSANGGSLTDETDTAYVANFSNIDTLTGGSDVDTFILSSDEAALSLDGGGNTDIVRIAHGSVSVWTLDGVDEKVTANNNEVSLVDIETAEGSTIKDTFNISSSATSFTRLDGRAGNDDFVISTADLPTLVIIGNDNFDVGDSLNFSSVDNEITWTLGDTQTVTAASGEITFESIELLTGSNTQADTFNYSVNPTHTITAGDDENVIDILSVADFDGVATISVSNNGIERYVGNQNGLDSAEGNSTTLTFSSNTDDDVNWLVYAFDNTVDGVDGINDGDITNETTTETIQFVNVNNLTGSAGNDTFGFTGENASITGTINGATGSNTITAKDVDTVWNINDVNGNGGSLDSASSNIFLNIFENIQTINAANTTADTFNVSAAFNTINGDANDFLIIDAANEVWELTGAGAGSTSTLANFTGITNLTGNGDNDTLIGIAQDNTWTINEANGGTVTDTPIVEGTPVANSFTFSGMENLAGNTGSDDFTITTVGSIAGTISGTHSNFADAGTDTLTIESLSTENITWTLTATGGSATGVDSFDTFEAYTGGAGIDVFELTVDSLSTILDGAGGTADIVRITHDTDAVWSLNDATQIGVTETVTSASNVVTLNNIEIAEGSDSAIDTFTISSEATHFDILRGRGEDDIFIVNSALLPTITLDGGDSGGDLLDLSAVNSELTWALGATQTVIAVSGTNLITFAGIQELTGSASSVDNFNYSIAPVHTIDAGESDGIIDVLSVAGVSGVADITASNNSIERYVGNQDGLTSAAGNSTTLTFLSGEDVDVTWNIKDFDGTDTVADGINDGDINGTVQFVNVNNLTGGDGNDAFVFDDTVTTISGVVGLSGTINGGAGNNSLTAADLVNTWVINDSDGRGTLTYLNGLDDDTGIALETVTSFNNLDVLTSGDQDDTFTLNDATATLILNAGGGADDVMLPAGDVNITLGAGVNGISLNGFEVITADEGSTNSFTVISATDDNVEWDITGANSGDVNIDGGASTQFNNFQTLIGSLGNDNFDFTVAAGSVSSLNGGNDANNGTNSITGRNAVSTWNITGEDGGTVNDGTEDGGALVLTFDNIDVINSGTSTDIFNVTAAFGTINGDAADTLNVTGTDTIWTLTTGVNSVADSTGTLVANYSGITKLGGTGGNDTLVGIAQDNTWLITGADSGSLTQTVGGANTFTFTGMENVAGNIGSDTFTLQNNGSGDDGSISGVIAGTYSDFEDGGTDTLTIDSDSVDSVVWTLLATGNSTTTSTVTARAATFNRFEAYTGGAGNDTFELTVNTLETTLDGAGGSDTVSVMHNTATEWALGITADITAETVMSANNIVTLNNIEIAQGSNTQTDTFTIYSATTSFNELQGRGGDDDFVITTADVKNITLDGGAAGTTGDSLSFADVASAINWNLGSSNTVSANTGTLTFSNMESLLGSNSGVDTFDFSILSSLSVDGGMNDGDIYDVADVNGNVVITVGDEAIAGIERYIGNQDGLSGSDNNTTLIFESSVSDSVVWNIYDLDGTANNVTDGINDGDINGTIEFVNVNNLTGGDGNDAFIFDNAITTANGVVGLSGTLNGGAGSNSLTAANVVNTWVINDGNGSGTLTYLNGFSVDLETTTSFANVGTLNSGDQNDTFTLNDATATLILNAGEGLDNVNLPAEAVDITLGEGIGGISLNGFETITANAGFDNIFRVISAAGESVEWDITGANSGDVSIGIDGEETQFNNFQTLIGSFGNDSFDFTDTNGSVSTIDGSDGENSITSRNVATIWDITRENGGETNVFVSMFDNIDIIDASNTAVDVFNISADFNTINGDVNDSLYINSDNEIWTLTGAGEGNTTTLSSFTGITDLIGNGNNSTLVGLSQNNTWVVTGLNEGTVAETLTEANNFRFAGMENLTGSTGADTFTVNDAGSITGIIDGGTDSDNILQGRVNTNTTWDLANNRLLNSDDNSIYVSNFTNIQTLEGRAVLDELQSGVTVNVWTITSETGGDLNGLNFTGFDELRGRNLVDTFNIEADNSLDLYGNNGADIFNIGANSGSLNGGNQEDIFTVTNLSITASLNGGGGGDTLTLTTGSAQNTATWVINEVDGSSLNETIAFSSFSTLNGDAGIDNFNVARGSDVLMINGNGGTDTLTLASIAGDDTVWNITGENSGTVSTDVDNFVSIENITAGAGDDEVIVAAGGSLSGLFDAGESDGDSDTLNLTAFVDGIVVELGAGANDVVFDPEIDVSTRINVDNFEEITAADHDPIDGENNNWLVIRHSDDIRFDIDEGDINEGSVFETLLTQVDGDSEYVNIASTETEFYNFGSFQGGAGIVNSNIDFSDGGNISGEYRDGTGMLNLDYSGFSIERVILVDITSNLESIVGNNNVLLRASSDGDFNDDNTWTIYAENTGTFASMFEGEVFELSFSGVNQLQGGTGNDTFTFTDIGDLTNGSIYGGGGNGVDTIMSTALTELTFGINQLDSIEVNAPRLGDNIIIDALASRDGVIDILGITELIGNATDGINTQLMSSDSGDFTWNILAAGSASTLVNNTDPNAAVSMVFENIDTVVGGEANDTFIVTSLDVVSNVYDGGGGNDELNLNAITQDLALSLDDSVSNTDVILAGIETLTLSAANNRLYGFNSASTWTLTNEDAGHVAYIGENGSGQQLNFSNISHLVGNAAQDDFVFDTNGALTGSIDGGDSALDSIAVNATSSLDIDFQLSDIDSDGNVILSDDIDSDGSKIDFVNVESIAANGTGDYSLFGAADVANMWELTSAVNTLTSTSVSGEEKSVTFSGMNNLYGGAAQDIFTLNGASVTGIIDGGSNLANVGADDTLTLSNITAPTVHIGDRVSDDINIVNIESITNESDSATLRGDDIANTWDINSVNGGVLNSAITFAGFTALVGGSNADTFDITAANNMVSSFDGGAAPAVGSAFDRLAFDDLLDAGSKVVSLDASYEGADIYVANVDDITGSALTNTLVGTAATNDWFIEDNNRGSINGVSFSGFGNLIGRNGVDTFSFLDLGAVSGFIDGGSQLEGTFDTVDFSELTSTINVVVGDTLSGFINIEQYIGNNRDAQFTAADFVNTWTIDDENSGSLTYTDSDSNVNTILFSGFDILTGGSLRDAFTLENLGSVTGSINGALGNDVLLLDLASGRDGEVAFNGGEGTNTITLSGGSNAERFNADYQPLSDGSALLDFTRELSTFSINYSDVATLNNNVFTQTLTVAPVVSAENEITLSGDDIIDIAIIDNTNDITHTVVSSSQTNSITIDGDANDTVVIDGAVALADTLTLNDVLIDFDEQSSIQANRLVFDRTGSIGSAEQRLATDVQALELITINGDTYLNNEGDLDLAALTSPVGVVDLFVNGDVTDSSVLVSANSLTIQSTSDIVLDAENNLTGDVSLSATGGSIVFNNGVTHLAGIEAATFDLTARGAVDSSGPIIVTDLTTLTGTDTSDFLFDQAGNDFSRVELVSGRNVTLTNNGSNGDSELSVFGATSGVVDIETDTSLLLQGLTADSVLANAAGSIDIDDVDVVSAIALNASQDIVFGDISASNINVTATNDLRFTGDVSILDSTTDTVKAFTAEAGGAFVATTGSDISSTAGSSAFDLHVVSNSVSLAGTINALEADAEFDFASSANVTNTQRFGSLIFGVEDAASVGQVTMSSSGELIAVGDLSLASGGNLSLSHVMSDATVTLSVDGQVIDNNDTAVNITANELISHSATGFGTSENNIETSVAQLSVVNLTNDVAILNDQEVSINALINQGDILLRNTSGTVTINNDNDADDYINELTGTEAALGVIDGGYNTGFVSIFVDNGALVAAGDVNPERPDLVAFTANVATTEGFGTAGRPLVLWINESITVEGNGFLPLWFENDVADFFTTGDFVDTSFAVSSADLLIEVESIDEVDPAIFNNVLNYEYGELSIRLPSDQLFEDYEDEDDQWVSGI